MCLLQLNWTSPFLSWWQNGTQTLSSDSFKTDLPIKGKTVSCMQLYCDLWPLLQVSSCMYAWVCNENYRFLGSKVCNVRQTSGSVKDEHHHSAATGTEHFDSMQQWWSVTFWFMFNGLKFQGCNLKWIPWSCLSSFLLMIALNMIMQIIILSF